MSWPTVLFLVGLAVSGVLFGLWYVAMMMRLDVEFFGGVLVGLIVGLAIGLSIGQARADCTGCAPGKAYEEPCLSWWTLPDGERICVEQPWQNHAGNRGTPLISSPGVAAPLFLPMTQCDDGYTAVAVPTSSATVTWKCARDFKEPLR